MPRKTIDAWLPYLDDVLALWTELGADFKVGSLTRANVAALRDDLKTALDKVNALQAQLGLAMDARDAQIAGIEGLAVKFRAAVIAQYGPRSSQAGRVPRLQAPRAPKTAAAGAPAPG